LRRASRSARLNPDVITRNSLARDAASGGRRNLPRAGRSVPRGERGRSIFPAGGAVHFSTRGEYGVRLMVELARHYGDGPVTGNALTRAFQKNYLGVSQNGAEPIKYNHVFVAPSNTGIHSGFDLNNAGGVVSTPLAPGNGDDALGFGERNLEAAVDALVVLKAVVRPPALVHVLLYDAGQLIQMMVFRSA
jgi:hypothetical protein